MASRVCYFCKSYSHMTLVEGTIQAAQRQSARDWTYEAVFTCDNCKHMSIGLDQARLYPSGWTESVAMGPGEVDLWLPLRGVGKTYRDVPEHIAAAASEAHTCQSVGAHRGAVILARAVTEAVAKDKGVTTGTLAAKIDELVKLDVIRQSMSDAAHEIRHIGNDMAHGDFVEEVESEESEETLTFMDRLLREVYQDPAETARAKATRVAKKAAKQTGAASLPTPAGTPPIPATSAGLGRSLPYFGQAPKSP